jgi:hypothetical protein
MAENNVTRAEFVGSGPAYPGETPDQAMVENSLNHLVGHLVRRQMQGISTVPGIEPADSAGNAAQDAAYTPAGQQGDKAAPVAHNRHAFDLDATRASIRAALRPGL